MLQQRALLICALASLLLFSAPTVAADRGDLPNLTVTPGKARAGLSLKTICKTKWGVDARHVTAAMKRQVFESYGLSGNDDAFCTPHGPDAKPGRRCEIDHLISRELGGADVIENLWPEPYDPSSKWNATRKDRLENRLHKEICAGNITLKAARAGIVSDWRMLYRNYFGEPD